MQFSKLLTFGKTCRVSIFQLKMNIQILSLLSLIYFIGEAGFETQNSQSDFIGILNNYHGIDGHEKITPISVIQEIYASNHPFLLTMLHLSFSELFQNTQI